MRTARHSRPVQQAPAANRALGPAVAESRTMPRRAAASLAAAPRVVAQREQLSAAFGDVIARRRGAGATPPSRVLQRTPGAPVQRFPANVYTTAYGWSANDYAFVPLGGGNMAQLFKLTQNPPVPPGQVGTVIVKALEVDEHHSIRLGEEFLRQMGMATPDDRVIMRGTQEFDDLGVRLGFPRAPGGVDFLANHNLIGGFLLMQDLGAAGATTMQSKLMQATTRAEIDEVFTWMTDPVVLDAVGKLIVFDSAIGNFDRITMDAQNFGNLMIRRGGAAATQVFLIDTNARLPQLRREILAQAGTHGAFYEERVMNSKLLKGIFANRDWAIGNWFEAIPAMVGAQQGLREDKGEARIAFLDQETAYIAQQAQVALAASKPVIEASFDQAMIALRAMMANKADPRRVAIKAASQGTQSFDTLKANVGYLEQRSRPAPAPGQIGPLAHAPAAGIVETYGRYKVSKGIVGVPANAAAAPATHQPLTVPKSLRTGVVKEKLKGDAFKVAQQQAFAAYYPDYQSFEADIAHHIAHLEALKPLLDELVKLRQSLAGPGETRNQRAMVSLAKRQAEALRLRGLLQAPTATAVLWAAQYQQQAAPLIAELANVSDRFANFRAKGPLLTQAVARLAVIEAEVRALAGHIG